MRRPFVFICLCILNLLIYNASAYNLKQIADKEYMSNSSITSLCQDERGLMWIGTCDGLNIYDGQEIEEFKIRDKEDYLSGNLIDNIVYTGEFVKKRIKIYLENIATINQRMLLRTIMSFRNFFL